MARFKSVEERQNDYTLLFQGLHCDTVNCCDSDGYNMRRNDLQNRWKIVGSCSDDIIFTLQIATSRVRDNFRVPELLQFHNLKLKQWQLYKL